MGRDPTGEGASHSACIMRQFWPRVIGVPVVPMDSVGPVCFMAHVSTGFTRAFMALEGPMAPFSIIVFIHLVAPWIPWAHESFRSRGAWGTQGAFLRLSLLFGRWLRGRGLEPMGPITRPTSPSESAGPLLWFPKTLFVNMHRKFPMMMSVSLSQALASCA